MKRRLLFILLTTSLPSFATQEYKPVFIASPDALSVAHKIWKNECAGTIAGLTSWNVGENFASLGIGHFIWYPQQDCGPFCEMFPDLLRFFAKRGVALPAWLSKNEKCPWTSREEFLKHQSSLEMIELRELLRDTIGLQAEFMALRLQKSLPRMVAQFPEEKRAEMIKNFNCLVQSPQGLYAVLDYLNFKGEGLLPTEAYKGEGWGLIQVLAKMVEFSDQEPAATRFAKAADAVLVRRVENSPLERNEKRWLKGWQNRIATYMSEK